MSELTTRELELLTLLAAGERSADIATKMDVKPVTFRRLKQEAAKKLGLVKPSDIALVNAAKPWLVDEPPQAPVKLTEVVETSPGTEELLPEPLDEISVNYPGKFTPAEWLAALPNIKARIDDGDGAGRLNKAAIMYRRQHAALTRQEILKLVATGIDEDVARRRVNLPVETPAKFFDLEGPWRGRFPLPAYVEIPSEPI